MTNKFLVSSLTVKQTELLTWSWGVQTATKSWFIDQPKYDYSIFLKKVLVYKMNIVQFSSVKGVVRMEVHTRIKFWSGMLWRFDVVAFLCEINAVYHVKVWNCYRRNYAVFVHFLWPRCTLPRIHFISLKDLNNHEIMRSAYAYLHVP